MAKDGKTEGLSCVEAGALGGRKVLALYGREHYQRAGRKGQAKFRKRHTQEDRRRFGAMGGRPKKRHYMGEGANLNDGRKGKPARSSSPLPRHSIAGQLNRIKLSPSLVTKPSTRLGERKFKGIVNFYR